LGLPSHREECIAGRDDATVHRDGLPDEWKAEATRLVQGLPRADGSQLATVVWDALDGARRDGAADDCRWVRPDEGAGKSVGPVWGVQVPDEPERQSGRLDAAAPEAELCTPDAARSGEQ